MKLISLSESRTVVDSYTFEHSDGKRYVYREFSELNFVTGARQRIIDRILIESNGAIVMPTDYRYSELMSGIDLALNMRDLGIRDYEEVAFVGTQNAEMD